MSHGGMGGGGGHHGHHGGHHGGVAAAHHADQSPVWNMAMQVEKDNTKRLLITDPRFVVGLTLTVFVILISLPYTLDFFQSHGGNMTLVAEDDGSKTPNAAALSMVGATLMGGGLHAQERSAPALGQAMPQAVHESPAPAPAGIGSPESDSADSNGLADSRDDEHNSDGDEVAKNDESETQHGAASDAFGAPEVASQSAQETVAKMLSASGMAQNHGAVPAMQSAPTRGLSVQPAVATQVVQQAVPAQMPAYGGAMPVANQPYYVYIPNQQFGQPAAAPAVMIPVAQPQMPAQLAALPQSATPALSTRAAYDLRSPFNPQTSAISSPLGMRRRNADPTVPMVPTGQGTDGSQRFRVWVNR